MSALDPAILAAIDEAVARRVSPPRETYFTVRDVAKMFGIHTDTCLRLVHSGKLRAVGRGKLLRIPQSAIAACFEVPAMP